MKRQLHLVRATPALILVLTCGVPAAGAGGAFGIHIGGGGFGVSVGFGDWGVYTNSWSDPHWAIDFHASLSGYGNWVWVAGLGRVWRPWVTSSWRPYTYGRWVSTGHGLTWVAYEPWGYIPHHYGNWAYSSFGWVWVPGYSYSCANVTWVGSGAYIGWYARPPRGWSHAARGYHRGYRDGYINGYREGWDDARYATFVGWNNLGAENVAHHTVTYRVASTRRIESLGRSPAAGEVLRKGGATVYETHLSLRTVSMDGHEITIARPEGMARSIERNAAESVSRALSEEALEQRQPRVRAPVDHPLATTTSSRSRVPSREWGSPSGERLSRPFSSSRMGDSGISTRSHSEGLSGSFAQRKQTDENPIRSSWQVQRRPVTVRQVVPRAIAKTDVSEDRRSSGGARSARRVQATLQRSSAAISSDRSSGARSQSLEHARRQAVALRTASSNRERASSSRSSSSTDARPSVSRKEKAKSKMNPGKPAPKRNR